MFQVCNTSISKQLEQQVFFITNIYVTEKHKHPQILSFLTEDKFSVFRRKCAVLFRQLS